MARPPAALALVVLAALPLLPGCVEPALTTLATAAAGGDADATAVTPVVRRLGVETFEPTLGVAPDGTIYYSTTPGRGVAIGFGSGVHKSTDDGASWTDVSPRVGGLRMPPETNDPYVYVDASTGRVFQFAMAPVLVCSILSWSDDGGATWTTNPRGCGSPPPWDHQSIVAAKPRQLPTVGYPNVLVQCTNALAAAVCARSLDGGLTWAQAGLASTSCGGLHGHLVSAPDGTLYLPKLNCERPALYVSTNDGTTWAPRIVTHAVDAVGGPDSAVAVDENGVVYYAFTDTAGRARVAVSTNGGASWTTPFVASPAGVTTNLVTIAARGAGKIALAYAGTEDLPRGYDSTRAQIAASRWNAYVTYSVDGTAASPTFTTVRATSPTDPLVRGACGPGRCPGMVDFIDVQIGPDGKAYAAFVDACTGACATNPSGKNNASEGLMITLAGAPSLA